MERPDSRLIRVFLSSTFVDFQEERSLLVQQVFPSLRRRARSREVEIVDVDLRWGALQRSKRQGERHRRSSLERSAENKIYFTSFLKKHYD